MAVPTRRDTLIHISTLTDVSILKTVWSVKNPAHKHIKTLSSKELSKLFYNKGRTSQVSRQKHRDQLLRQYRVSASIPARAFKA